MFLENVKDTMTDIDRKVGKVIDVVDWVMGGVLRGVCTLVPYLPIYLFRYFIVGEEFYIPEDNLPLWGL